MNKQKKGDAMEKTLADIEARSAAIANAKAYKMSGGAARAVKAIVGSKGWKTK